MAIIFHVRPHPNYPRYQHQQTRIAAVSPSIFSNSVAVGFGVSVGLGVGVSVGVGGVSVGLGVGVSVGLGVGVSVDADTYRDCSITLSNSSGLLVPVAFAVNL